MKGSDLGNQKQLNYGGHAHRNHVRMAGMFCGVFFWTPASNRDDNDPWPRPVLLICRGQVRLLVLGNTFAVRKYLPWYSYGDEGEKGRSLSSAVVPARDSSVARAGTDIGHVYGM